MKNVKEKEEEVEEKGVADYWWIILIIIIIIIIIIAVIFMRRKKLEEEEGITPIVVEEVEVKPEIAITEPVKEEVAEEQKEEAKAEEEGEFECPECGAPLKAEDAVCPKCGQEFEEEEEGEYDEVAVADYLKSLDFKFSDGEEWYETWDDEERPPKAVQVIVTVTDEGGRELTVTQSTMVYLTLTENFSEEGEGGAQGGGPGGGQAGGGPGGGQGGGIPGGGPGGIFDLPAAIMSSIFRIIVAA